MGREIIRHVKKISRHVSIPPINFVIIILASTTPYIITYLDRLLVLLLGFSVLFEQLRILLLVFVEGFLSGLQIFLIGLLLSCDSFLLLLDLLAVHDGRCYCGVFGYLVDVYGCVVSEKVDVDARKGMII